MPDDVEPERGDEYLDDEEAARLRSGQPYESADRRPDTPLTPESEESSRFSEGQEDLPDDTEKERVGTFATGQEHHQPPIDPGAVTDDRELLPETERERRFSEGQEQDRDELEKEHRGDFATGQRELDDDDDIDRR